MSLRFKQILISARDAIYIRTMQEMHKAQFLTELNNLAIKSKLTSCAAADLREATIGLFTIIYDTQQNLKLPPTIMFKLYQIARNITALQQTSNGTVEESIATHKAAISLLKLDALVST